MTGASPSCPASSLLALLVMMLGAGPHRHAIIAVEEADRRADVEIVADQRERRRRASSARSRCWGFRRAGWPARALPRLLRHGLRRALPRRSRTARRAAPATGRSRRRAGRRTGGSCRRRGATKPLLPSATSAAAPIERSSAADPRPPVASTCKPSSGTRARNAAVDHVDRAADRLAAEQQHRGPVKHLDALGGQRVDGHRMVGRGVGHVDRADAVGQHPDALALEAAQHRARRARARRRSRTRRAAWRACRRAAAEARAAARRLTSPICRRAGRARAPGGR